MTDRCRQARREPADPDAFERAVQLALDGVPADLARLVDNVAIDVVDHNRDDPALYGLYTGVPLAERGSGYAGQLPDRIEIYRRPLQQDFGHDLQLLAHEIRVTVLHELAHHFGIDDVRLDELGWS